MKFHNVYVSYKEETGRLLYWMINTSNSIIPELDPSRDYCSLKVNLTGKAPVSDLILMAKLIATHRSNIPSKKLALFQSVIELRTIYNSQFAELASISPSKELLNNNAKHKHFIDVLTEAFHILGGEAWLAEQAEKEEQADEEDADADTSATANRFSILTLDALDSGSDTSHQSDSNGEADEGASSAATPRQQRRKQNRKGKGKKGKGKKARRANGQHPGGASPESYHIIEDDEQQQYLMAVVSLAKGWIELRQMLESFWQKVAYRDLNSALVAAMNNIAVAVIKQSEAVIFGDFPGNESLDKMILTLTGVDPGKAGSDCQFTNDLGDVNDLWEEDEMPVDIREAFLINACNDLIDFIDDFQKNRSGKPTKRMLAQLKGWDPYFDLQKATKEERLKWRRSYTINWLYDLVNAVAAGALYGSTEDGKGYVLEDVDWGTQGPFRLDRRLFGLFDFAVEITALAMLKPGTRFRHKITPHLAFNLQCAIDAWTVSRGWAASGVGGHALSEPAPGFVPRCHLDIFLGKGEWETKGFGFSKGVAALKSLWGSFRHAGEAHDAVSTCIGLYEEVRKQFDEALGISRVARMPEVVLSRFSATNRNGLWDYSPFLCGAGLAEGLELSYRCAMRLWDELRELQLVVYLQGCMVTYGHLESPLPLFTQLETMFQKSFYSADGGPSYDCFRGFAPYNDPERKTYQHRRQGRLSCRATASSRTIDEQLDMYTLQLFKHKSELSLYKKAGWDPDRIPDSDVSHMSALGLIRLSQMSRIYRPATNSWMIEGANFLRTHLVKMVNLKGGNPDDSLLKSVKQRMESMKEELRQITRLPNGIIPPLTWVLDPNQAVDKDPTMTLDMMLSVLWNDLYGDICCDARPYSSLNYLWITVNLLKFYDNFEEEAKANGSAAIKAMFEDTIEDLAAGRDRRVSAAMFATQGVNEELSEILGSTFKKYDTGVAHMRYFDEDKSEEAERGPVFLGLDATPCCVL